MNWGGGGTYFTPAAVLLERYREGGEEEIEYAVDKADISQYTET